MHAGKRELLDMSQTIYLFSSTFYNFRGVHIVDILKPLFEIIVPPGMVYNHAKV